MDDREKLILSIEALEAERSRLGDVVVDTAIVSMRDKLAGLEAGQTKQTDIPRVAEIRKSDSLEDEQLSSTGERRLVTILFCDVTGSTAMGEKMDPEEWTSIMNAAFPRFIEPVYKHGGIVSRLMGDAILALFGAPVAHENDALRACRAALDIVDGADRIAAELAQEKGLTGFNVRIGINTGLVVVGQVGSDQAGEYTAMGDAVNTASRFESAATPGTILMGEYTNRLVTHAAETTALTPIKVKGKAQAVPVFRLKSLKSHHGRAPRFDARGYSSRFVGREKEIAFFEIALNKLAQGQGSIISISGEAGLGKTRLLNEIRRESGALHPDGPAPKWLEGSALSYGQSPNYWPFHEIIWAYAGITDGDSEEESWQKLEEQIKPLFPENSEEILPYLAELISLPVQREYTGLIQHLDGEAMDRQIVLAARRFFKKLAQRNPLILVFEDFQTMDEPSAALLAHLLPLVQEIPLLFCGLSRPVSQGEGVKMGELAGQELSHYFEEIELNPLSDQEGSLLIAGLVGTGALPETALQKILAKAEGNPFYLEEIFRTCVDTNTLTKDDDSGGWRLQAPIDDVAIPDSVHGVIMAHIDRLDEGAKADLRTASVIGRSFFDQVLRATVDVPANVDRQLNKLITASFILEKQREPDLEYSFRHGLVHEATYQNILKGDRQQLHARVGQAIEKLFPERLEEFYGMLAYHFSQAEDWEKAQEYLFRAANHAERVAADTEALAHYRQALDAFRKAFGDEWDPVQQATISRKLGEVYSRRGDYLSAQNYLEIGLSELGHPVPASKWGVRKAILKEIIIQSGYRLLSGIFLGDKKDISVKDLERWTNYRRLVNVVAFIDSERFLLIILRGLNLTDKKLFPEDDVAVAKMAAGIVLNLGGFPSVGDYYVKQSKSIAEETNNPGTLGALYYGLTNQNVVSGNFQAAITFGQDSAEYYEKAGEIRDRGLSLQAVATGLNYLGNFPKSIDVAADLLQSGLDGGDKQVICWGEHAIGMVRMNLWELAEAISHLTRTILIARTLPDYYILLSANALLGRCLVREGRFEEAFDAFKECEWALERYKLPTSNANGLYANSLAEAYLTAAELAQNGTGPKVKVGKAQSLYNESDWLAKSKVACKRALKEGKVFLGGAPQALLLQGRYEWLRGNPQKARDWWEQSLRKANDLEMSYNVALVQLEIGRRLGEAEHLRHAEETLNRLGVHNILTRSN